MHWNAEIDLLLLGMVVCLKKMQISKQPFIISSVRKHDTEPSKLKGTYPSDKPKWFQILRMTDVQVGALPPCPLRLPAWSMARAGPLHLRMPSINSSSVTCKIAAGGELVI